MTARATPGATPQVYTSIQKLGDGGHGGLPLTDLPAAIAIDYRVSGHCVFSIRLVAETLIAGLPSLTMTVTGPESAGTWHLVITPGRYYVEPSESIGCVYSVTASDDR